MDNTPMGTEEDGAPEKVWRRLVDDKRQACDSKIPPQWRLTASFRQSVGATERSGVNLIAQMAVANSGVLCERELGITERPAHVLLAAMAQCELSAQEVTLAFCKRAAVAQQLACCLTETFFDAAMDRAKWLDGYLAEHNTTVGPLHGLPIALKDCFQVRGATTTLGYVCLLRNPPATQDSSLVELLSSLGAVFYCKTNVPQTLMTADSHNNVFGRVLNPHNTSLTAGGSTGGQAALQALHGSPIGVGSDVAGSIRIPALCCAVYGFKPTVERVPYGGQVAPGRLMPGLIPAVGPLASSLEDIEVFMKSVLNADAWLFDAACTPVPWISPSPSAQKQGTGCANHRLIVGILPEDPNFPWLDPVPDMMHAATAALEAAGHEAVILPHDPTTSASQAASVAFQLIGLDPNDLAIERLSEGGEPMVPSVEVVTRYRKEASSYTVYDIADMYRRRDQFAQSWRRMWKRHHLDLVLAPVAQHLAVPHDTFGPPVYTLIFNLLDYPACTIPYKNYPADRAGDPNRAPFALQVVTPRFRDEQCIATAKVLDAILNPRSGHV